jgi:circadian clock protein KaiC
MKLVHSEDCSRTILIDRVTTGIKGLDSLLEGGFPRGSMVLLAGSPGSGKTIASAQFLYHGATKCDENGVYVSFAEQKNVFVNNMARFGLDFRGLENEGKFKFLDMATTTEAGISETLNAVIKEALSIKAQRLVIDSFSAMALAFEKKIEARVILHAFEKMMHQTGSTTLLLVEIPTGNSELGLGFEEFVADGLILFETIEEKIGIKKRAIIRKMRGTHHNQNYSNILISNQGISLMPYVT